MVTCEEVDREFFSGLSVEDFLGVLTAGDGGRTVGKMAALLHLLQ
jgi:hypothetical protein